MQARPQTALWVLVSMWLTANGFGSPGVWQILLPPKPPPGACPTLLLDISDSENKKSREMAYLLSRRCSWQPSKPTEPAGEGGFGLPLCTAAAKAQASSSARSSGKQTDLGAGSWEEVTSETTTAVCSCAPESDSYNTFCC